MSGTKRILQSVTALLAITLTSFLAVAQAQPRSTRQNKQSEPSPDQRARKVKSEPNNAFTRWVNEDVDPIVTDAERDAFNKLKTNEERDQFIKIFWDLRDPDPDTEENEYRDQYYERLAYANEHFSSGKPGRMTDRGRIYIKFGKPDEIEAHPAGGMYQPTSYAGSITAYPFEKWFYRYLPGVGSGIEIEFVDPTGTGEYRIARDANEKNALAHVPGGQTAPDFGNADYGRLEDSPLGRIQLLHNLDKAPEIERKYLDKTRNPSPILDDNPLNFDVRADFFKMSDSHVLTAFTVQTENKDLVFEDSGGLLTARLNIFGRIVAVTERRVGTFEDAVTTSATVAELTEAKERRSAYSKVTILPPGRYRLDVVVRDVTSGATGIKRLGFEVPKYEGNKLSTSSLILAAKLESMQGQVASGQFVIGQTKVIPNLTGNYQRGEPVGIYLQVYNAGIDQTTLRPSVDVEYVLSKDGKEMQKELEDWRGVSDSGQRLTLARLLDTRNLTPGEYEITIRIRDRVSSQALSPAAKFTVTQ